MYKPRVNKKRRATRFCLRLKPQMIVSASAHDWKIWSKYFQNGLHTVDE